MHDLASFPIIWDNLAEDIFLKNWEKKKKKFGRDCCSSSVEQVQGYVNVESELLQFVISLYAVQANIVLLTLNLIQILIDSPMKKKNLQDLLAFIGYTSGNFLEQRKCWILDIPKLKSMILLQGNITPHPTIINDDLRV